MKSDKEKSEVLKPAREDGKQIISDLKEQLRQIRQELLNLGRIQEELASFQNFRPEFRADAVQEYEARRRENAPQAQAI